MLLLRKEKYYEYSLFRTDSVLQAIDERRKDEWTYHAGSWEDDKGSIHKFMQWLTCLKKGRILFKWYPSKMYLYSLYL